MTEAPALPFLKPGGRPTPASRAHDRLSFASASTVRERRRAENRSRRGSVDQLHCECPQPSCQATFPADAEAYRGKAERFIIAPAHFAGDLVVAAADQFFVVDGYPARPYG